MDFVRVCLFAHVVHFLPAYGLDTRCIEGIAIVKSFQVDGAEVNPWTFNRQTVCARSTNVIESDLRPKP